jgi:hypothetical protein
MVGNERLPKQTIAECVIQENARMVIPARCALYEDSMKMLFQNGDNDQADFESSAFSNSMARLLCRPPPVWHSLQA